MMFENQLKIGEKIFDIKPVKMIYIKANFYSYYMLLKKEGIKIFQYQDGEMIFDRFLEGVFDGNKETIDFIIREMDTTIFKSLLDIVKKVNEFEDEEEIKNE